MYHSKQSLFENLKNWLLSHWTNIVQVNESNQTLLNKQLLPYVPGQNTYNRKVFGIKAV